MATERGLVCNSKALWAGRQRDRCTGCQGEPRTEILEFAGRSQDKHPVYRRDHWTSIQLIAHDLWHCVHRIVPAILGRSILAMVGPTSTTSRGWGGTDKWFV